MPTPRSIQRTYLLLMLGNTLAASFIWGINTIFLLDAGLSNAEAFAANAFFTAGMVIFEVPTGVVADTIGRRASYLLGTRHADRVDRPLRAPVADRGAVLGVGGRVDAARARLHVLLRRGRGLAGRRARGDRLYRRPRVGLRKGQIVSGDRDADRLGRRRPDRPGDEPRACRSWSGPRCSRSMFVVAFRLMHDVGFTPEKGQRPVAEMRKITADSIDYGWRVPAVKWLMLSSLFTGGVGFYAFYALQPYLLELYGDPTAYSVAGLVAAIVAGAQILGGIAAPRIRRLFHRRTSALLGMSTLGVVTLALIGRDRGVRGGDRADRRLGPAVRRRDADPPGLHQRDDPLAAARDDPLVRLADELRPAASGPSPCSAAPPTSGATRPPTCSAPGSRRSRCRSSALAARAQPRRHGGRRARRRPEAASRAASLAAHAVPASATDC